MSREERLTRLLELLTRKLTEYDLTCVGKFRAEDDVAFYLVQEIEKDFCILEHQFAPTLRPKDAEDKKVEDHEWNESVKCIQCGEVKK